MAARLTGDGLVENGPAESPRARRRHRRRFSNNNNEIVEDELVRSGQGINFIACAKEKTGQDRREANYMLSLFPACPTNKWPLFLLVSHTC